MSLDLPRTWQPILADQISQPYFQRLQLFIAAERAAHSVFPPEPDVLAALRLTPYADVKVLLLGQDPYHGEGQAHGLCFSVGAGIKPPPSLINIFKELQSDLGVERPRHGDLTNWASQGVLMLNAVLTVRAHEANSHKNQGWEMFTDAIISAVSTKPDPVIFVLWGAYAQRKSALIDGKRHRIIKSAHPSPLSARNGFFGSKPFSVVNAALSASGRGEIDWRLT
jgi:uracil-DNA glycosylase